MTLSRETILRLNDRITLFENSFIHSEFLSFYFRGPSLANFLSFRDNDIVVHFDLHEACDALFWWVFVAYSNLFHRFAIIWIDYFSWTTLKKSNSFKNWSFYIREVNKRQSFLTKFTNFILVEKALQTDNKYSGLFSSVEDFPTW